MLHLALKLAVELEKREAVSSSGTNMHREPWFMKTALFNGNEPNRELLIYLKLDSSSHPREPSLSGEPGPGGHPLKVDSWCLGIIERRTLPSSISLNSEHHSVPNYRVRLRHGEAVL